MERERNKDKEEKEEERKCGRGRGCGFFFKRCYSWFVLKIDRFKKNKIYSKQCLKLLLFLQFYFIGNL